MGSCLRLRWGEKEGELNDRLGACNAKNRNLTLFVEGMQSDTLTLTQRLADLTAACDDLNASSKQSGIHYREWVVHVFISKF